MSYDRLCEAIRLCEACPLDSQGRGVPGVYVGEKPPEFSGQDRLVILGEAPGGVEMAKGEPFVGGSGQLLRSLLKEVGLTSYYLSNIAKHQPPKVKGKQQAPDSRAVEACAPFLRAELELVRPTHLLLLGKTAAKLVCEGNFSMGGVVNQTYKYRTCPSKMCGETRMRGEYFSCDTGDAPHPELSALVLFHPSYFLRSRTAPWVQKQVREWKGAVRLFLGDKAPTYAIEQVHCPTHSPP